MRQGRNGTSEGGHQGTAPHPEPAEPGLLARISKQCQQEQREDGGKNFMPLSPPQREKAMATHSSVLAWRIPGTAEPGVLPSMGSHRVRHN